MDRRVCELERERDLRAHPSVRTSRVCQNPESDSYMGKRSRWAKEDAERESLGIPDPLAEFTVPQERNVLRARHRWEPVKKVFEMNAVTTEFMRLLVILVSNEFDYMLVIFVNDPCAFCRESSTGLRPKATRCLRHWRGPSGTLHSTGR